MVHAPTCLQLLIVRTAGYSCETFRCDECGATQVVRHIWNTPEITQ